MRKGRWFAIGFGTILAVLITVWVLRPRGDPQIIGAKPTGVILIPRSNFPLSSRITIPWIGGRDLQLPPRALMPLDWAEDPNDAGIFTFEAGSRQQVAADAFASAIWIDGDGEEHRIKRIDGATYTHCPFVFGDRAMRMAISIPPYFTAAASYMGIKPVSPFRIDLPPLKRPAPFAGAAAKIDHVTISAVVESWLGPSFTPNFRFNGNGLRESEVILAQAPYPSRPPAIFRIERNGSSKVTIDCQETTMLVRIAREEKTRVRLADISVGGATIRVMKDMAGMELSRGSVDSTGGIEWNPASLYTPDRPAVNVMGEWIGRAYDTSCVPSNFYDWKPSRLTPGLHDAVIYRPVSRKVVTFDLRPESDK